jgi:SAM-dependent methyltransferase
VDGVDVRSTNGDRSDLSGVGVLSDEQIAAFDFEQIDEARWLPLKSLIDRDFADGQFTFLDVGGGNGSFADRLLAAYPRARGAVLDNSEFMLKRNAPNERKLLLHKSVADLQNMADRYDIVSAHWLLHHIVGSSRMQTRSSQRAVLGCMSRLLTTRGRLSVYENNYSGWLGDSLPGFLIYELTASKRLTPLTRRVGANSAGVGVRFRSRKEWLREFDEMSLVCTDYAEPDPWQWRVRWHWRLFTTTSDIRAGHFWLRLK